MRRRANETNARRRVTDARDVIIYFAARKLAAFARFCALSDFDLQLVGVSEIPRGDAETARGNLLDCRAHGVAVFHWRKTIRVFAAFACVRFRANAVHRNS